MNVAIVVNTSWNIFNFRLGLVRTLLAQGHTIHTVAPTDRCTKYLVMTGCIHHHVHMDSRGANPIKDAALAIELWSLYRKIKPDVVLHYTIKPNIYGTFAAALLKIPIVNNVCGLGTVFLKANLTSAFALMLYKIAFRFPRKVFFQNPDDLSLFLEKKLVAPEIVDLVPGSGIDLNRFTPQPFARNEPFTFLLISRLIIDKGVMEYIEAIRLLHAKGVKARFQILGAKDPKHKRGIKLPTIDRWIEDGVVEYLGTTEDVRPFIHNADCIVLPSYREGTPRVLLEAASSGKPIITTAVPGCRQVVEHNYNGLLCLQKYPEDLGQKMMEMSEFDTQSLRTFGENGRKKMEKEFSESVVIAKYLQALWDLDRVVATEAAAPFFRKIFTLSWRQFTKKVMWFTKNR